MARGSDKDSRADKVRHVKNARQTRDHECHWPDCNVQVKPAQWGCRTHWGALPQYLRDKIWDAYRPGQENDGRPSERYLEVAHEVQEWIANKDARWRAPGDPKVEVGSFDRTKPKAASTPSSLPPAMARAESTEVQSRLYQLALHYADRVSNVIPWQKLVTDEFAERAAIREYVGGIARHQAEWAALEDLVEHFNRLVSDPARSTSLP